jgi:hypothetical protein
MKKNSCSLAIAASLLLILHIPAEGQKNTMIQSCGGTVTSWPRIIPARISDPTNDLFVMTLGEVTTPIAQGTFDPVADIIMLNDGSRISNYYRDSLGLKYYTPVNKKIYPLPPSGFCTWYYYYQDISEKEVKLNTDWIAANLLPYGAQYVQIDDGWQAESANGRHGSRDWTGIDKAFPSGMADLASYIKSKGMVPGIWIAPHGQSNEEVVKNNPGVFILKPDGTSASQTWEGDWLLDPTSAAAKKYFYDLFSSMVKWGFDYYKIDGQPIVVEEYAKIAGYMSTAGGDADSLYRSTLDIIRSAIGPNRYLLGCWGLPVEGAGIMDGSRTGGDVVLGWDGFMMALSPTMESYYQHNIMWYTDPDVMLLRQPLTTDQARVWATMQGLTGQALMSSDRLPDLSQERVNMLKSVFPATDIRPLDLFPSRKNKHIWDLKVSHLNRNYDVVGLFNFDKEKQEELEVKWSALGISGNPVHVFDFWNNEYIGVWEAGISLTVNPTSCRVLTLLPDNGDIQLISTSRHITQGWVDLLSLKAENNGKQISGVSKIPGNDPYKLHFVYPRGTNYRIKSATAICGKMKVPVKVTNHQGWATIELTVANSSEVSWNVSFEQEYSYSYNVRQPEGLTAVAAGLDGVKLTWESQYYLNAGYQVYLDSVLSGYTPGTSYIIKGLDPSHSYKVWVRSVWSDGSVNKVPSGRREYSVTFKPGSLVPATVNLSDIEYTGTPEWFSWPVTMNGKRFDNSVGMMIGAERKYEIKGLFNSFKATVGIDDSARKDDQDKTIEFVVVADGRELWRSGQIKAGDSPKEIELPVSGVQCLIISVTGVQSGDQYFGGLPGDWAEARLIK